MKLFTPFNIIRTVHILEQPSDNLVYARHQLGLFNVRDRTIPPIVDCYYAFDTRYFVTCNEVIADHLFRELRLVNLRPARKGSPQAQIGFSAEDERWYGWSHNRIQGFGIDDLMPDLEPGIATQFPWTRRGGYTIRTDGDAMLAAMQIALRNEFMRSHETEYESPPPAE